MSPVVTVIIPTFNRAHLIGNAIQSVLDQSFIDYELIVVDDGSTDNTREVVSKFKEKVIYIFQENKERSAARNIAMKQSRGKYITFLDSDDLYLPDKLRLQVESMESNPQYGMSYTYSIWLNEEGAYLHTWRGSLSGRVFPEMMRAKHNKIALSAVMIRRKVLDNVGYFNESINICEDLEYWCRVAMEYPVFLVKTGLVVINTNTHPVKGVFYNYFKSTISYYQSIFKSCHAVKGSEKRAIFIELAVKYYLNSTSVEQKKFVLREIKRINTSYLYLILLKIWVFKIVVWIRKYNGIRTLVIFFNNYLLIRLPQTIMSEDFEYGIKKKLTPEYLEEIVGYYYIKDESENCYVLVKRIERNTRIKIREILIEAGYLNRNRIALMLKM